MPSFGSLKDSRNIKIDLGSDQEVIEPQQRKQFLIQEALLS